MQTDSKPSRRGRKSPWHSPTKMIRLPAAYEAEIIAFAHKLDGSSAAEDIQDVEQSFEAKFNNHVNRVLMSLRPGDRRFAKRIFKKLADRLQMVNRPKSL